MIIFKDLIDKFTYAFEEDYDVERISKILNVTNESLDSNVAVQYYEPYIKDTNTYERGKFYIDDYEFDIVFEIVKNISNNKATNINDYGIGINFERWVDNSPVFKTTKDLKPKQVLSLFATVMNELRYIISKYNPNIIFFKTDDPEKFKLYERLSSKYADDYIKTIDNGSMILSKDNIEIKNIPKRFSLNKKRMSKI